MQKIKIKKIPNSIKLRGKKVLLRVDFNVPLAKNKKNKVVVEDDFRIKIALPTIINLSRAGAKIILVTHIGRPDGRTVESLRLKPVLKHFEGLLPPDISPIHYNTDWNFDRISKQIELLEDGEIYCLENIRFEEGEEKNDKKFAKNLSDLADIYVNEAFSVSHRAHASVEAVTKFLPSYGGINLIDEVQTLSDLTKNPKQPMVVIIGGAKVDEKVALAKTFTKVAATVLTGGVVGNSILKILGHHMGRSKIAEHAAVQEIKKLSKKNKRSHVFGEVPFLQAPIDVVVSITQSNKFRVVDFSMGDHVRANEIAVDIGPKTVMHYSEYIRGANTLVWNGPMGLIEQSPFDNGTKALAQLFASRSKGKAFGVIGGGDLLSVFDKISMAEYVDYRSTGGGAMLDFLAGKKLPGIEALKK